MNKITKISISVGTLLALATFAAQGAFATGQVAYSWAKVMWNSAPGAKWYNIYYKESGDKKWTHAVRRLPWNATSYTINYLKRGTVYWYNVSALNDAGKEYWWSGDKKLNSTPMP